MLFTIFNSRQSNTKSKAIWHFFCFWNRKTKNNQLILMNWWNIAWCQYLLVLAPQMVFFAKQTKLAFFTICLKTLKQKICHIPEMPCSFKMVWHYFTCWITFPQPAVRFVCKYWTKWQSRATFCFSTDSYHQNSIKAQERIRRGFSEKIIVATCDKKAIWFQEIPCKWW